MTSFRTWTSSALVAGALVLSGCSSSGSDTAPSESKILAKLKTDSTVSKLKDQLPAGATSKYEDILACVAKALHKDAKASDLDDYVSGDKSINDVSGDKDQAQTDVQNCVKSVIAGG